MNQIVKGMSNLNSHVLRKSQKSQKIKKLKIFDFKISITLMMIVLIFVLLTGESLKIILWDALIRNIKRMVKLNISTFVIFVKVINFINMNM